MAYKSALVKRQTSLPVQTNKNLISKSSHLMHKTVSVPQPSCSGENRSNNNSSNRSLLSNRQQELKDFEVSGVFSGSEWTSMGLSEKNQWIRKFLVKTKADVVYVYNQVGEIMDSPSDGELMGDITTMTQISSANCLESIELKRLKSLRKDDQAELEKRNRTIKDQLEILNKDTCSQETQTCGTSVEGMEKKLSDASTEIAELRSLSNIQIDALTRDLDAKNEEFADLWGKYSSLQSKNDNLNKTLRDKEAHILENNVYKNNLKEENTKLANDLLEARKHQDELYEQLLKFKNVEIELEETQRKLIEETARADRTRVATVGKEMIFSVREDEFEELENENLNLREAISKYKETIKDDEHEIIDLKNTVYHYRAEIYGKEKEMAQMDKQMVQQKNRIQCMINQSVQDERNKNKLLIRKNRKCSQENRKRIDGKNKTINEQKSQNTTLREQNERLQRHIEYIKLEKEATTVQSEPSFIQRFKQTFS